MNRTINTLEEFKEYNQKGYSQSATSVIALLGTSETKGRDILKGIKRIDISEKLYHEIKKKYEHASRSYFNDYEVFKELINRGTSNGISVSFGDMRKVFSKVNTAGNEIYLNKTFILENSFHFYMLFKWSKPIKDIILDDLGYSYNVIFSDDDTIMYAKKDDVEYKTEKEIIDKSLVVKYTRMIKRDFYVKFTVGKKSIKYFQSMGLVRAKGLSSDIESWIEEYETSIK